MDQRKILIVEDDKFLYDLYQRVLLEAGFLVDVAIDGEEGLKRAEEGRYDLVLLDIMLPKKNGVDVLKALKSDGSKVKNLPVIVLSNLGQEDIIQQCLRMGAVGYLVKVQNLPQEVVSRVKEFFGITA